MCFGDDSIRAARRKPAEYQARKQSREIRKLMLCGSERRLRGVIGQQHFIGSADALEFLCRLGNSFFALGCRMIGVMFPRQPAKGSAHRSRVCIEFQFQRAKRFTTTHGEGRAGSGPLLSVRSILVWFGVFFLVLLTCISVRFVLLIMQ